MKIRRLPVVAAAAAALAVAGLAGCGDDDGDDENSWNGDLAAIVGSVEITESEINSIADDLRGELSAEIDNELQQLAEEGGLTEDELAAREEERYGELDEQMSVTRRRVIEMRILTEATTPYAEERDVEVADPPVEYYSEELGLAQDNRYVQVVSEFFAVLGALQGTVEPVEPAEADQREIYDRLVEDGLTQVPFEEAQGVLTKDVMGEQVAIRNLLVEAVEQAGVQVNPEYDLVYQVPVSIGEGEVSLSVPLG